MPTPTPTLAADPLLSPSTQAMFQALADHDLFGLDQALLAGADVNAFDITFTGKRITPLGTVAAAPEQALPLEQRLALMDRLLDAGATPCVLRATGHGWEDRDTPFLRLLDLDDPRPALHLLARCPELVAWHDAQDRSTLCVAIMRENEPLALALLDAGADPSRSWPRGVGHAFTVNNDHAMSPVRLALTRKQPVILDRLLELNASTEVPEALPRPEGLYTLAVHHDVAGLLPVLDRHQVPMLPRERTDVIPDAISRMVPWSAIERLIVRGADPHARSQHFGSALQAATSSPMFYGYVEPLLTLGVDPETPDGQGRSVMARMVNSLTAREQALGRRMEQAVLSRQADASLPSPSVPRPRL